MDGVKGPLAGDGQEGVCRATDNPITETLGLKWELDPPLKLYLLPLAPAFPLLRLSLAPSCQGIKSFLRQAWQWGAPDVKSRSTTFPGHSWCEGCLMKEPSMIS